MIEGIQLAPYITTALTRQQAEQLFEQEALVFGGSGCGVPEYRMIELFGTDLIDDANSPKCSSADNRFTPGKDVNFVGGGAFDILEFFYRAGFMRIVSSHNYRVSLAAHKASKAGQHIDDRHARTKAALDALEAEEERKREERRAKRAAAKARIQEATEV